MFENADPSERCVRENVDEPFGIAELTERSLPGNWGNRRFCVYYFLANIMHKKIKMHFPLLYFYWMNVIQSSHYFPIDKRLADCCRYDSEVIEQINKRTSNVVTVHLSYLQARRFIRSESLKKYVFRAIYTSWHWTVRKYFPAWNWVRKPKEKWTRRFPS